MRKQSNIRVVLSEAQTHEVHQMSLRENRSQSSAISILVAEALENRRKAAKENEELLRAGHTAKISQIVSILRGEAGEAAE
jgi:hypothetical protein